MKRAWIVAGGAGIAIATVAIVRSRHARAQSRPDFNRSVLARAESDLGVIETSPNSGPRVDEMLRSVGINVPANWCAAAVSTWVREAARELGVGVPIAGSASVLSIVQEMRDPNNPKVGWIETTDLRAHPERVRPGMIVAWTRGLPGSGLGHIGIVESSDSRGAFVHIDGNAGANADRVAKGTSDLSSASLIGMGFFRDIAVGLGDYNFALGYYNDPPGALLFPLS